MTPVFAENSVSLEQNQVEIQQGAALYNTEEANQVPTLNLPENELNPNSYKQPVSKRKIAKKFLLAMLGVAISSIILYVLLSLYNKIRGALLNPQVKINGNETSLVTPDNLSDAVKTYLDKTNWDK